MIEERSGDISGQVLVDIQELKSVSMDYLLIVGHKEGIEEDFRKPHMYYLEI